MARHLRAILALPFTVTLVIPTLMLLLSRGTVAIGWDTTTAINWIPVLVGILLIATGISLLAMTISLFGKYGDGTLAPWDPPAKLVVIGIYRRVRNPMISGVFAILLGEAILFRSLIIFGWWIFFVIAQLVYITQSEEPTLIERFGDDYRLYQQNVPSWMPRLTAWEQPNQSSSSLLGE